MAQDTLPLLLQRFLHGELPLEALLDGIDEAQGQSPDSLIALMREIETLHGRGEIPSDAYRVLIGRLEPAGRARPGAPTVQRAPAEPRDGSPSTDRRIVATPHRETSRASRGGEIALEPGAVINDRFVLEECIGAGGFGIVFKARDLPRVEAQDRDPYVAIKFINPDSGIRNSPEFPDFLIAFEREARRHMTLAHPNILIVHDYVRNPGNGLAFLVMELLKGEPLDRLIQRHPQGLPFKQAWALIKDAGEGLKHAHEQDIIHSDFKPGNVFAVEASKAKVLDFGIARVMSVSAAGGQDGTRFDGRKIRGMSPAYASPEILLGKDPSPRDDIYALACVAYELLSGHHPLGKYAGEELPAINAAHAGLKIERTPGMRRSQYKALVHGLEFQQAARTPSVTAFLEEFAGSAGVGPTALRKFLRTVAATFVVVVALGLAILLYLKPNPDEQLARRLQERAAAQLEESNQKGGMTEEKDPEEIKNWLAQGDLYLAQARRSFDPGQLSQGVSSAYGAFKSVLGMEVNDDAVNGIVEIVRLYEAEAKRRFDAGDFIEAAQLAEYALEIDPDRASLKELELDAKARLNSVPE
jgi:serine/threonine protein kinase